MKKLRDINPMAVMMVITTAVMCLMWVAMVKCLVTKKTETKIELKRK